MINKLSPRGRRDDMPLRWQFGLVRNPHMAKLQAASVRIAYGGCAPTAGPIAYMAAARLGLGHTDGRIAVSLNARYGEGA